VPHPKNGLIVFRVGDHERSIENPTTGTSLNQNNKARILSGSGPFASDSSALSHSLLESRTDQSRPAHTHVHGPHSELGPELPCAPHVLQYPVPRPKLSIANHTTPAGLDTADLVGQGFIPDNKPNPMSGVLTPEACFSRPVFQSSPRHLGSSQSRFGTQELTTQIP